MRNKTHCHCHCHCHLDLKIFFFFYCIQFGGLEISEFKCQIVSLCDARYSSYKTNPFIILFVKNKVLKKRKMRDKPINVKHIQL